MQQPRLQSNGSLHLSQAGGGRGRGKGYHGHHWLARATIHDAGNGGMILSEWVPPISSDHYNQKGGKKASTNGMQAVVG